MEINNLSDAEFKTLVIRMLKKLIEYNNKIKNTQEESLTFFLKTHDVYNK